MHIITSERAGARQHSTTTDTTNTETPPILSAMFTDKNLWFMRMIVARYSCCLIDALCLIDVETYCGREQCKDSVG